MSEFDDTTIPEIKITGTGRPRIEIEMETLRALVRIQCTADEVAAYLDCSIDTLERRLKEEGWTGWGEFYKTNNSAGKVSLRRMQWESARKGDKTMQIWLGKQILGQADKVENTHQGDIGGVLIAPASMTPEQWVKKMNEENKDKQSPMPDGD